jgi:prepilin-type N-terminal cleavage/methylation domain-containing protein
MRRVERCGFTLLELIAAMSLMGFVMLGGIMLIDQLNDSSARIAADAKRAARDGNAQRLLARLLLDATSSTDSTRRFRGDSLSVEFWTWCEASGGWMTPCKATLAIDEQTDSSAVLADLSTGGSFSLRRQAGHRQIRYYDPTSPTDTVWLGHWSSSVTLPAALGLVGPVDTIMYPVSVARD